MSEGETLVGAFVKKDAMCLFSPSNGPGREAWAFFDMRVTEPIGCMVKWEGGDACRAWTSFNDEIIQEYGESLGDAIENLGVAVMVAAANGRIADKRVEAKLVAIPYKPGWEAVFETMAAEGVEQEQVEFLRSEFREEYERRNR